jgi:PiT family inorganic phosphate transporter
VALALLFDFTNGFHDAANSISTVVATGAMPAKVAVWFSAFFNFVAYFFVGTAVANTVAKVVHEESVAIVFGALVAAVGWNYLTWWVGMPSSSSHAIIGGLVGAGLAAGGTDAVEWGAVQKVLFAIVASPAVAFGVAALATVLVVGIQKVTKWSDNHGAFKGMQVVSAACVSFGHGANDAQKTMGVIAALLVGAGYLEAGEDGIAVPEWVALSAYAAIALGTVWGGWRIIETMGLKLTSLNAKTGVAANVGATTAIFGATGLGIPISTTHAAASSVVGAGVASRRGTNWKVVGEMVTAWVITIPATATVGFFITSATEFPTVAAWAILAPLMIAMAVAIIWAMKNTIGARHVQEQVEAKDVVAAAKAQSVPQGSKADHTTVA